MLRLVLLALIAIAVAMLVLRFTPRLRARVMAVARHPFVRQILSVSYTHLTLPTIYSV